MSAVKPPKKAPTRAPKKTTEANGSSPEVSLAEQPVAEESSPLAEVNAPSKKGIFSLLPPSVWVGALLLALIASLLTEYFPKTGDSLQKTLVLDTRVLIDAKSATVAATGKMDTAPDDFVRNLKVIAQRYADSGHIILNAGYVVYWPDSIDITASVAAEMGIDLAAYKAGTLKQGATKPNAPSAGTIPATPRPNQPSSSGNDLERP